MIIFMYVSYIRLFCVDPSILDTDFILFVMCLFCSVFMSVFVHFCIFTFVMNKRI